MLHVQLLYFPAIEVVAACHAVAICCHQGLPHAVQLLFVAIEVNVALCTVI